MHRASWSIARDCRKALSTIRPSSIAVSPGRPPSKAGEAMGLNSRLNSSMPSFERPELGASIFAVTTDMTRVEPSCKEAPLSSNAICLADTVQACQSGNTRGCAIDAYFVVKSSAQGYQAPLDMDSHLQAGFAKVIRPAPIDPMLLFYGLQQRRSNDIKLEDWITFDCSRREKERSRKRTWAMNCFSTVEMKESASFCIAGRQALSLSMGMLKWS